MWRVTIYFQYHFNSVECRNTTYAITKHGAEAVLHSLRKDYKDALAKGIIYSFHDEIVNVVAK